MINRDYLKQILSDKKKLLPLSELRCVAVPKFDELSVKNLFPMVLQDKQIMLYFPDSLPQGRLPDRTYFFNVMHTLRPELVKA